MKRSSTPPALRHLDDALDDLRRKDLLRTRPEPILTPALSFCSNDYLGLADRSPLTGRAGAAASRLVVGEAVEHRALERELTTWLGTDAALTFTSGYAANLGVVSALAGPEDLIVSDALNHASLIDGARLSRAEVQVVPHADVEAVDVALRTRGRRRAWVITESYFSMDADGPDLRRLREVCDAHDAALVVDEAHALGVFGPDGRGLAAEAGITPDVLLGTFGKSFGAGGAFVAGCEALVAWVWNRARSFVFSTGLSPAVAAAARDGIAVSRRDPTLRETVLARADQLRRGLKMAGASVSGFGPIVPLVVGDAAHAVRLARFVRDRGVHVQAIRPPSVPPDTARLRITTTARHSTAHVDRAVRAIHEGLTWLRSS